jgi:hypothetical protein
MVTALASPAAGWEPGGGNEGEQEPSTGGGLDGNKLDASVTDTQVEVTRSGGQEGEGNLTASGGGNWTPPTCWYEPYMTPEEFRDEVERLERDGGMGRLSADGTSGTSGVYTDIYRDNETGPWYTTEEGYDNYNLDQQGEGMWWVGVVNANREDEYDSTSECKRHIFWAENAEAPEQEAITPEMLAEYAYDEISVPDTEIEMNPDDEQVVNLPTWVWLDEAAFEPVSVRAELPNAGLWAETTAEPVSLTIEPGTEDATLFPSDGVCEIAEDGSIGEPYTEGRSEDDPPCGVMYERATHAVDSFELTATLTWQVSWEGSDGSGGELPDGVFETTQDIVVDEVQTIIR